MTDQIVTDHGAVGDGSTNDTRSIQAAIDACGATGGGRVVIPADRHFVSGSLVLRSHVELHLEPDALLAASAHIDDFTESRRTSGLSGGRIDDETQGSPVFIGAESCEDVSITGTGTIDGGGRHFVTGDTGPIYEMSRRRPYTVFLVDCADVTIRDVTVRDGAYWTVRLTGCRDALIAGITIRNDWKLPNNDGIDIDTCRRVRVENCDIVAGDDGICLKACQESTKFGACEDISITHCTIVSTSSGVCIGSEIASPIRRCRVRSCTITASNRGLSLQLSEGGGVSDIDFENIVVETRFFDSRWWGCGEPIYVCAYPWRGAGGYARDIRFRDIDARSENGVLVRSEVGGYLTGLLFENVRVRLDRWSGRPGGVWDLRPHPSDGFVEHATSGFHIENAVNVRLHSCSVDWLQPEGERADDFRHALCAVAVGDLVNEAFRGSSADPARWSAVSIDGSPA